MKKNKMLLAALCCSGVIAWSLSGCSAKDASGAGASAAVESSIPETESAPETESGSEAENGGEAESKAAESAGAEAAAAGQTQGGAGEETEAPVSLELGKIWGEVTSIGEDQIVIDNQGEDVGTGEVVVQIDSERTKILEAVNGFPVALEDLSEGETVYVSIKPMMTMSLPPIVNAEAVICQGAQDAAAPEYVRVQEMEQLKDDSYLLTASDGSKYQVPADCEILPYLTRNIVTLADIEKGSACLLWTDEASEVQKIVLFAD